MKRPSALLVCILAVAACAAGPSREAQSLHLQKAWLRQLVADGNYDQAFGVARALQEATPDDPEVLALRGVIYMHQDLLDLAKTDLEEALRSNDRLAFAHSALGVLYDERLQHRDAEAHHRRAAELAPEDALVQNNLAFCLYLQGRLEEALAVYNEALRLDPANRRIRNNIGFALARLGDFARAAESFSHGGSPAEAKNNLAFAYERHGDLTRARALYAEALALDPSLKEAQKNLAHLDGASLPAPPTPEATTEGRAP